MRGSVCVRVGGDLWAGGKAGNLVQALLSSPSLRKMRSRSGPNDDQLQKCQMDCVE